MNKKMLQGKETKKRLIDCATNLFKERGYHNVTVDDIIREAGSSKGGFYTHFKAKEKLLFEMLPIVDDVYMNFMERGDLPENSVDRISTFIQYVFELIGERVGVEFISIIYSSQIKDLDFERVLLNSERKYYNIFNKFIEEGKCKNEIRLDMPSHEIISIFTTCIRGVIYDWCLYKGEFNLSIYGEKVINMMLKQIKN